MTRDQKIDEASRLSAEGMSNGEIARRLGVTPSAVWKWLHPDRVRELNQQQNARPERQRAKAEWMREFRNDPANRKPCPGCGGPSHLLRIEAAEPELCRQCRRAAREERRGSIQRWWAEGLSMGVIAERLDTTVNTIGVEMDRMRREGYDLPYRYTRSDRTAA